jgi:hypothetical protein
LQNKSGLIPPWPERDAAAVNKQIWSDSEPVKPSGPTLEEKKERAFEEAIDYLRHADAHENKNLACILMLRHDIGRKDADAIVARASERLAAAG